ncbi:hypothetical protein BELL_0964g00010 [Botrytis elliptica]|uniref:Uncharacterized protein n=1 Tax=Botrytis elliptica TaxID=278938 RepID=A0A4Z1IY57_9HELO|nr:hypothetical protein BELL_0964g00010 [Botrytis elliptica]
MSSEAGSPVSFSIRRANLISSLLQLPDSGESIDDTTNGLIDAIQARIRTKLKSNSDEVATIKIIEYDEKRVNPTNARPPARFVISQTRYLLNNLAVFRQTFAAKAFDPDFDPLDLIAYESPTHDTEDLDAPVKERGIYLDELMRCHSVAERDGYEAIKSFEPATILSHLRYWHKWLSKRKFPDLSKKEMQATLFVAYAFGANLPSINAAARKFDLQIPIKSINNSVGSIDRCGSKKRKRAMTEIDESITPAFSSRNTEKVDASPRRKVSRAFPASSNEFLPDIEKATTQEALPPPIGAVEGLKFVIIMKTDLPTDQQQLLSTNNWGKVYTHQYIRCFKTSLVINAPNLHFFFNAREMGYGDEVGNSGVPVSDGHVWDPIQSDTKKSYSNYPIMFYDEVISDFGESWNGWTELDPWIQGETGQDVLWLAVQVWLLFAECNGEGDPPQRTKEELALKEDLVWAVGKWLGAEYRSLRRFNATWGRKMKSDDPNNKTRETTHGFKGRGYYKNKRGPNDPLRFGK